MTPDERERMMLLCSRIADEKDMKKFTELIKELTELLEGKRRRIGQSESQS